MRLKIKTTLFSIIIHLGAVTFALPTSDHQARVKADSYRALCSCIILTSFNGTANADSAQELLLNISDSVDTSDQTRCDSWTGDPMYKIETFADQFGKPTTNLSESAGVFAPDIYAFCGPPKLGEVSNFEI